MNTSNLSKLATTIIAGSMLFMSSNCLAKAPSAVLMKLGNSTAEVIPKGWKVLDAKTGDLNQDGIDDLVFAVQDTDAANITIHEYGDVEDDNPRVLAIYFGTKNGQFKQKLVTDRFIIKKLMNMTEPLEGFSISKKGVLSIHISEFYSMGSWTMSDRSYKFRYQNNKFVLIGYDSETTHRASGDTTIHSINFLNKTMSTRKGNIGENKPQKAKFQKFKLNKPITLGEITPFAYEFNGIYL